MNLNKLSLDEYLRNEQHYKEILNDNNNRQLIPLLNYANLQDVQDNTLIRFRGMIQDMIDPEIYLERYEMKTGNETRLQDGRYRDILVQQVSLLIIPFFRTTILI